MSNDIISLKVSDNDFIHPNEKGHEIAAKEIYNYLLNSPLIEF